MTDAQFPETMTPGSLDQSGRIRFWTMLFITRVELSRKTFGKVDRLSSYSR